MAPVRRESLSNGLRIAAVEMPAVKHVAIRLVVGAGSRDDPRNKAGISHFVEHLLLRGTERHPHESALRAHAASIGARMNAHTTKECTALEIDVSARHLRAALQLLADVLLTPTFNGIEIERRIVLEEMSQVYDENDGSIWTLEELADSKLWPYNSLGVPIIGEPRTVLGITLDDAKEYIARHYRAGGIVLSIAGCFELDAIMKDIQSLFGGLPAGVPYKSRTVPGTSPGALHLIQNGYATRFGMRMAFPCGGLGPTSVHGIMGMLVLGTEGAGRIHHILRSRAGIAYTGDAEIALFGDAGHLTVYADVKKENLPQLVQSVSKTLRDLRERGPSPEELLAAQESYLLSLETTLSAPGPAAASAAGRIVGDDVTLEEEMERARATRADDVLEWARATLRAKNAQLVLNGPREENDLKAAWRLFESTLGERDESP